MIGIAEAPVSPEAYERSHPVPSAWVATFRWSADFALNQENGESTGPHWKPSVEDVERMLAE